MKIQTFSFNEMHLKMLYAKYQSFFSGVSVLNNSTIRFISVYKNSCDCWSKIGLAATLLGVILVAYSWNYGSFVAAVPCGKFTNCMWVFWQDKQIKFVSCVKPVHGRFHDDLWRSWLVCMDNGMQNSMKMHWLTCQLLVVCKQVLYLVITVHADGLAPDGARPSARTMMTDRLDMLSL